MEITTRQGKLLALLFLFLSYLTLCLSVPTDSVIFRPASHKNHASLHRGVVKRGIDPEYKRLDEILNTHGNTRVEQDDEKFMAFGSKSATMGSGGFAGCTGLVIVSSQGVIIGHYSSDPSGANRAKEKLPDLIDAHKDALAGAKAWVYGHVRLHHPDEYTGTVVLEPLENIVQDKLGLTAQRVKYIEPSDMLVDKDGNLVVDDFPEEDMAGFVLVQHPGGQSQESIVTFVTMDWQKAGTTLD